MPSEWMSLLAAVNLQILGLKQIARRAIYTTPLHRFLPQRSLTGADFDRSYADGSKSNYLAPFPGLMFRDSLAVTLIQIHTPQARTILDIGCAAGWLARHRSLSGLSKYIGVDLSSVAIERARLEAPAFASFECSPLESFATADRFDVIVFSEVLYYLNTSRVLAEVRRYEQFLNANGKIIVSLKDDAKSAAVLKILLSRYQWKDGCVFQVKQQPTWKTRSDSARPAYLVGVLSLPE